MTGDRRAPGRTGVLATAAVVAFLALLEIRLLPPEVAQRASDLAQAVLAGVAAAFSFSRARRGPGVASGFWALIGLGCLSWAGGQAFWVTRGAPLSVEALYPDADVLFTASTAFFVVAFVVRPDRGWSGRLAPAIDVAVLAITVLYLFAQTALVHLLVGDVLAYELASTRFFDFRGLALLLTILWALGTGAPPWKRMYQDLAPAFLLLQIGTVVTNHAFEPGAAVPYHPGFYDLPWTLPFVWIALVAARPPSALPAEVAPPARATGWARTRRATGVAFVAVVSFPIVQILLTVGETADPGIERLRAGFALAGMLLVAALYLLRQLFVMRETEATLREGEERFRALLESGGDVVGVYAKDLRVRYVSGSLTRVTGYRPEHRVGRLGIDFVHPDDSERVKADVAACLAAAGRPVRTGFRARRSDGAWRDLEADIVDRTFEPAVRGIVANFRDVTERRRAEAARERAVSLLEATLESTADGLLVVDASGRIERFNQKFSAMWRLPADVLAPRDERALGFVLDQLQEPAAFLARVHKLYAQPEAESFDVLRLRDGRVFERYSLPQRLAGEVVGRVWSFRDVSERAHAEEAMARLVAIIEATPDLVATADASGRPLYVNRAGRRMLGLEDAAPLLDPHVASYYPPADADRLVQEAIPAALRDGSWSGELALRRADGGRVPVLQVILAHRSPGGEIDFLSTIARDISARKQAEAELRRSQTMAPLGSLVAGVAHEVREPLFGIASTLNELEARFREREDQRPYARVFREQLDRLTALMNDLLEYGKPASLDLEHGSLQEVVVQALAACSPLAERAHVAVESRLTPGLPPLRMDPKRLAQVFRNLVENGVQHSPAGGRVRIGAGLVERRGGPWVECAIEDTGPGFRGDDLPRVFEPFFSRRHGGTGLGLSIVYRIVTDHGGTVVAGNGAAGGARVTVSLPVAR